MMSSAENLLISNTQAGITTVHRSAVDIEEQVIQTENALQNEEEQRCTGKENIFR